MKQNSGELLKSEIFSDFKPISEDLQRIKNVAVIGVGVMGRGIVQAIAQAGFDVIAVEKNEESLNISKEKLEEALDYEIQRWAMTKSEKKSILNRIEWTTNIEDVKECELVIEAVDEDFELKKLIFKKLDEICPPHTIFVSNTSTLSLTKISEVTKRPDKIIGMHFLNPVPKVPLVELVRALKTSDETFKKVKAFAEQIGKTVVEVYEYPGFVTTRVIVPMLNEAMHVLMEGIATAEGIDTAMKLGYNFQMGPLEMADTMGLDEVLTWMETLYRELGEKYRPCPLLRKLVREGKLGKKTGEGFFKYDEYGRKIT
ncbi:3-hydroxyacyl-CoA dehydrogenase [Candidatus Kryptonium thompsonii]|jgi:3-hydroxybutyryl-CoA dehydrogenase|uniref:3-hydroxyacyl-CoA dehydrogenase n=1 Tax=Candidatus Kryptonium thompsonii TaxID=1633631 RepID=A0A0P1LSP2_9BACT|nr:3-hydroxyacyl-CoA dehydrogenase NAD-binding domain-containing protein [Candidatus Kryptonium thompsoni]CUS79498.1 3-hydroxyacyl-CoA dehydrogenase [Candidatus Kryptonium thompsoni]CUS83697.1 3-hydroxyacyl-CoA dehydrogenase [Candidatus Kryptonium thompsoni]CUS84815.1 3-hydroxyacyl-CoA dehydrogenase [Candidatus Kryptonium thompsoni]CUS84924.1 3-hydroxyacyl-CoA dehydrogenase [Candidatus Kryptonium thompsoni]CUS85376.1 3-hydroxyacyl-CoA dehydrogenase [Candidatus Kryptonium thompsoni]